MSEKRHWLAALVLLTVAGCGAPPDNEITVGEADLDAVARGIHDRVLALDTHDDIPFPYATAEVDPGVRGDLQVDLPKMREGGLDAGFFVVYVEQGANDPAGYAEALAVADAKFDAIHRMVQMYPEEIELATTAAEVERIHVAGKLVALIGIENGWPVGLDLANLAAFHARGGRYITLVHNGHNQLADSANPRPDEPEALYGGLSDLGRQAVEEMNRLGILVDVSHGSKATMLEAARISRAPIIASHSSCGALHDVARNMDDEQLQALADNGGVIQIVAVKEFLLPTPAGQELPDAGVSDLVDHIDHAVQLIGIEHVGISSDFDGGGGLRDWDDASETYNVTHELVKRGYSEAEIAMLWSGNTLRILGEAERVAAEIQSEQPGNR